MEQSAASEKITVDMCTFIQQLEHQMRALSLEKNLEVMVEKTNCQIQLL